MPHQLMRPEALLVVILVLWGIAGKLDEPLEGFDREATSPLAPVIDEEARAPTVHLLCTFDEVGESTARRHAVPLLTSASAASLQPSPPLRLIGAIHSDAMSRRLTCVVTDDE
ncbi:MAG TPA: hypothetical protein PLO41_03780 [Rubrivivax sp.]|nr:hypothetical protein [Rubrivivax sp.]